MLNTGRAESRLLKLNLKKTAGALIGHIMIRKKTSRNKQLLQRFEVSHHAVGTQRDFVVCLTKKSCSIQNIRSAAVSATGSSALLLFATNIHFIFRHFA